MSLDGDHGGAPGGRLAAAARYFLEQADSGGAAYAYPDFRRQEGHEQRHEVEVVISADLWKRLAAEADRQGVSPDRMLEHAAFYFAAAGDAGGISGRIAEEAGE